MSAGGRWLSGNRFLVLGRAGMDFYADPPGAKVDSATRFFAALGGSSANIAAAITRQGGAASLVTTVSDDAVGQFCLHQLDHYGIGRQYVRTVGGEARTSLAVVATRLDDTQTVIYRNRAADFEMTAEDVEGIDYAAFSALIATGTALAMEPSRSASFRSFELARQAGLTLILDIDYRPYSWTSADEASEVCSRAAAECDLVVGNDVEFGFLAGSEEAGLEKARELVRQGARAAIYKMGERGAVTITPEGEHRTGIYRTEALKPTGAGDAFMGGLVSALGSGLELHEAVLRGSATAAIVVSRVGCAPAMPTSDELEEFLKTHPGPTGA